MESRLPGGIGQKQEEIGGLLPLRQGMWASGLDCGGNNEDGRMTPNLDVFCKRAEDLLSSWMWGVRECVEWRMTPKCSVWSRKENAAAVAWAWHDFRCSDMGSKIMSLGLNVLFWYCLLDIWWGSWGLRWKCESGVPERVGLEIPPWEMSAYGWYLRSNKGLRHSKPHNQCRTASYPHRVGKWTTDFDIRKLGSSPPLRFAYYL